MVDISVCTSDIYSEDNLSLFLAWLEHGTVNEDNKVRVLQHCHLVNHSSAFPAEPILITLAGARHELPQRPCAQEACARCQNLRGGYQFRFVSSFWTPVYAICGQNQSHDDFSAGRTRARSRPFGYFPVPAITPSNSSTLIR